MNVEVQIVDGPVPEPRQWAIAGAGAVVSFAGIVRPTEDGRAIEGLVYEAYRPMAERQIESIARALTTEYKLLGMRIAHSVGWVRVGECSFRLDVAAAHRQETIAATGEFINRLKQDVPIWKQAR
jgi:molybdopterin synthase catalytic subunit